MWSQWPQTSTSSLARVEVRKTLVARQRGHSSVGGRSRCNERRIRHIAHKAPSTHRRFVALAVSTASSLSSLASSVAPQNEHFRHTWCEFIDLTLSEPLGTQINLFQHASGRHAADTHSHREIQGRTFIVDAVTLA